MARASGSVWYKKVGIQAAIVSGMFVLAAAVLSPYFAHWLQPSEPKQQASVQPSEPKQQPGVQKSVLREKSARELLTYVKSLPPLQRDSVITDWYVGRWVRWEGRVQSVRQAMGGFEIAVVERDGYYLWTFISFSRDWSEQIEALRENDVIAFHGKISAVDAGSVVLSQGELLLPEPGM